MQVINILFTQKMKSFLEKFFVYALIISMLFLYLPPAVVVQAQEASVESPASTGTPVAAQPPESTISPDTSIPVNDNKQIIKEPAKVIAPEQPSQPLATGSGQDIGFHYEREATAQKLSVKSDEATGALVYQYPLTIPAGRDEFQPDLALTYNSQDTTNQNLLGYSWSVNIPYIERIPRKGVDKLYTGEDFFYASLAGELATTTTANIWQAKDETGDFLEYKFLNNTWTATDKAGTVYKFGFVASSRQDNTTGNKTYKWLLEEIRDKNDNYIRYEYFKDAGQIYPSKIFYTGNGLTDGIFEIDFLREARSDTLTAYNTGFPVSTNYRINEIQTKVNGVWTNKYSLSYTTGDNGVRSLLSSITESGQDELGGIVILPATTLSYQDHTPGWTSNSIYLPPEPFTNDYGVGTRLLAMDNDGLIDVVRGHARPQQSPVYTQYLNEDTSTGWVLNPSYATNILFTNNREDQGWRILDIDSDGFDDLINAYESPIGSGTKQAYTNDKDNTGWSGSAHIFPYYFYRQSGLAAEGDQGVRLFDLNGDGLVDVVRSYDHVDGAFFQEAYLNSGDGTGWGEWVDLRNEITKFIYNGRDFGLRVADINGDGLADLVHSDLASVNPPNDNKSVFINRGDPSDWFGGSSYIIPEFFTLEGNDAGTRLVDVNGDGLADMIRSDEPSSTKKVYINTGNDTGWSEDTNYTIPEYFTFSPGGEQSDQGTRLVDVNGDGLVDIIRGDEFGTFSAYLNNGPVPDLLSTIGHSTGAQTSVTYKASTQYADSSNNLLNPSLPQVIQTVETITTNDGNGVASVDTYEYEGGYYYYNNEYDRKFAGFAKVTQTDDLGNETKTYYHQGNSIDSASGETEDHRALIGRAYKVEQFDNASNLYQTTYNDWDYVDLGSNRYFAKLSSTAQADFDGDSSHKDKAQEFTYDNTSGNVLTETNQGEVTVTNTLTGAYADTGTDKTVTTYSYAVDASTGSATNYVSSALVQDGSSNKISEVINIFDGLVQGQVSSGNQTQSNVWVAGTSYQTTNSTYNTYGLPLTQTDDNSHVTTFTYDSFSLFPASITNDLQQTTNYTYDYHAGQVKTETDPNGQVTESKYDGLGRIVELKKPDPTNTLNQVVYSVWVYNDTSNPRSVTQTNNLTSTLQLTTYSYLDGFDRTIQVRNSSETAGTYAVTDTIYDSLGRVEKQSLPYFGIGSANTTPTAVSELYTTYTYDALDRVKTETNAVGSTSYVYDDWKTVVTDPLTNQKDLVNDARGNLVQVTEYNNNGVNPYQTYYEYDLLSNLTKITDAEGNIRSFTYDALGNRLTAEDLHAPADTTFGSYAYTYDDIGNLLTQVNPEGDTVTFVYDVLDRVLTEDSSATTATDKSYTYDTCTNGIGRLCSVTTSNPGSGSSGPPNLLFNPNFETSLALNQGTTDRWGTSVSSGNTINYTTVSPIEGSQSMLVTKANTTGNTLLEQSIVLTGGTTYNFKATLKNSADAAGTISVTNYRDGSDGNGWGWQGLWWSQPVSPGQTQTIDVNFTPSMADPSHRVIFQLKMNDVSAGEVRIDLVEVKDPAGGGASSPIVVKSDYAYDLLGNKTSEGKTIDSVAYTTAYGYDRAGNTTLITKPNGYETKNTYNTANLLEKVETKESGGVFADFITNLDYSPLGQVTYQANANGTDTTNTYDQNELYRLKNKLTMAASSGGPTPPIANFTATPLAGDAPLTVNFTDTSTQGTNPITSWSWDFDNNGTVDSTIQNPQYIYNSAGTYTVSLTVSDGTLQDIETKVGYITVTDPTTPPTADFSATPTSGDEPLLVNFTDLSTAGTNPITSWAWDIDNNGTTDYTVQNPSHTYASAGTYSVKLTVSDGTLQDTKTKISYITVNTPPSSCGTNNLLFNACFETTEALNQGVTDRWGTNVSSGNTINYTTASPIEGSQSMLVTKANTTGNTLLEQSIVLTGGTTYNFKAVLQSSTNAAGTASVTNYRDGSDGQGWGWQGLWWSQSVTPGGQQIIDVNFTPSMSDPSHRVIFQFKMNDVSSGDVRIDQVEITEVGGQAAASSGGLGNEKLYIPKAGIDFILPAEALTQSKGEITKNNDGIFHIAAHIPSETHIQDISYTYDAVGNITTIVDASETNAAKTSTYAYDDLYRLTSAAVTGAVNGVNGTESYIYNSIGNILTKIDASGTHAYSYNGDQGTSYANPHAVTSIDATTYTYDKNGNVTSDGTWTHTWSYDNRLVSSGNGTTSVSYAYDETGQRALLDNGSKKTHYPNGFYNKDVTNNKETIHLFASGSNAGTVEISGGTATTYTNHTDHLTGSNVLTNSGGAIEQLLDYFPFGEIRLNEKTGSFDEQRKATGHMYDEDSGLYYMNARYQNPAIGRFISQDPVAVYIPEIYLVDPQQLNTYSYARNNPLRIVDPTGLYVTETGEVEKGDTKDSIVGQVNEAFSIETDWNTIAHVSYIKDPDNPLEIGSKLSVGSNNVYDVSRVLDLVNETRAEDAKTWFDLYKFRENGPWDLKNSNMWVFNTQTMQERTGGTHYSYLYQGGLIRNDAPGNINYGYVAHTLGVPNSLTIQGAIGAQVFGRFGWTQPFVWRDNDGDTQYVQQGFNSFSWPWEN